MKTGVIVKDWYYHVQIYTTCNGETYERWHTMRAFVHEWQALAFQSAVEGGLLNGRIFMSNYNPHQVVIDFMIEEGVAYLKTKEI